MFEQALMGIITAEGKQNFKTCLHFLNFKLSSPSSILLTLLALHAIRSFRMQFALRQSAALLLFYNVEALNLFKKVCRRNPAAWQCNSATLHTTEFYTEFWSGLPLEISIA